MPAQHQSNEEKLNPKPAHEMRKLFPETCGHNLKIYSFQLFLIGCGKLLLPDQWLALVKEVCMALKVTDALCAGRGEIIDRFEYKGLSLIAVG